MLEFFIRGPELELDDRESWFPKGTRGNPDYYHSWVHYDEILRESDNAVFIRDGVFRVWVTKKLIRGWRKNNNEMFVHLPSYNNIRKGYIKQQQNALDGLPCLPDERATCQK